MGLSWLSATPEGDPISLKPLGTQSPSSPTLMAPIEIQPLHVPTGEDLNFTAGKTDVWDGTPRKILDRFLPSLLISADLPTLNALLADLMLRGEFPQEGGSPPGTLSLKRAEILMTLGYGTEAAQVVDEDILSGTPRKDAYEQMKFLSFLSARETEKACIFAISKSHGGDDLFWVKAGIVCNTLQGEPEKARVRLEALRETSPDKDSSTPLDELMGVLFESAPSQGPLSPWIVTLVPDAPKDTKAEVLAELEAELKETQTPRAQLQERLKTPGDPKDGMRTYFLQRVAKLYHLEESFGAESPLPSWRQDLGVPREDLELLSAAAQEGRKGEVILLAAALLTSSQTLHPEVSIQVLRALHTVGYKQESEALALELLTRMQD